MQDNSLLEPLELYNSKLRDLHEKNTIEYFDDLVKKAGTNVEENKKTVSQYKVVLTDIDNVNKKLSKFRTIRTLLIVLILILAAVGAFCCYSSFTEEPMLPVWAGILIAVLAVAIDIGLIVLIVKKINKIVNNAEELKAKLEAEAQRLLNLAWEQMASLNSLYDWGIPSQIIPKTTPLIQMDKVFDAKKFQYLHEKYGLLENENENVSTYFVQSGSILGNPFLLRRDYKQLWATHTYQGSLTIHWTETVRNSDGSVRTVSKSQTLYATVEKPIPNYEFETFLIYGNDAAPKLTFTRQPSGINGKDEKQIAKIVKDGAKDLEKLAREAIKNGSNYTKLGNDEFEVLFGGIDRNNEMEYRLLFTPLAQKNELKLIKSKAPYGDDFYFEKSEELNFIQSYHSQNIDYYANPNKFINYDYEEARRIFINYNNEYFKGLFFDLAPLISIPLYQQHKPKEYIYQQEYRSNISSYEHESIANSFDPKLLMHPETNSGIIMKTYFQHKDNEADKVKIRAHSFATVERVDYVSVRGGDGYYHNVPVPWIEYIPIYQDSLMEVKEHNVTRHDFNNLRSTDNFASCISRYTSADALFERGLFALLLNKNIDSINLPELNNVLNSNNSNSNIANSNNSNSNIANNKNTEEN